MKRKSCCGWYDRQRIRWQVVTPHNAAGVVGPKAIAQRLHVPESGRAADVASASTAGRVAGGVAAGRGGAHEPTVTRRFYVRACTHVIVDTASHDTDTTRGNGLC